MGDALFRGNATLGGTHSLVKLRKSGRTSICNALRNRICRILSDFICNPILWDYICKTDGISFGSRSLKPISQTFLHLSHGTMDVRRQMETGASGCPALTINIPTLKTTPCHPNSDGKASSPRSNLASGSRDLSSCTGHSGWTWENRRVSYAGMRIRSRES
jgi:hypothetical protein